MQRGRAAGLRRAGKPRVGWVSFRGIGAVGRVPRSTKRVEKWGNGVV